MSTLEFNHVWKIYDGDVVAVQDANFFCNDGEFISVLGPSGCGKSSSLRMIAGLEKVSKGEIKFDGNVANDMTPRERNIALAFESYALYSPLTIYENLAFPLKVRGYHKKEIHKKVMDVAAAMELVDVLDRKPAKISGGQQQRVSLARALVRDPNVFLLDEPLSHMDQAVRSTLRARIRRIHDQSKATTIYVTHDQEEAVALSDRVIVMNLATIQQMGTVDEIYNRPVNEFVAGFVGDPRMNFLEGEVADGNKVAVQGNDEIVSMRLPQEIRNVDDGKKVLVGIRPEKVIISKNNGGAGLSAQVEIVEFVGDYRLITFRIDERNVKVLTPIDFSCDQDQTVYLHAEPENLHVFDRESGQSLLT
ncbi:MAG: ABC transporter ATP-binding protein [Deltaproteobacteria bacterium]|nr:ABC transporter ATP-binding protein [Deltaproteobacteria bacterium]